MSSLTDAMHDYDPRRKLEAQDGLTFLTGTQALVRMVFDQMRRDSRAGLNTAAFVSGYPGSPLGNFDIELARHKALCEELHVTHLPGHNEELAATAVYGSQAAQTFDDATYDGVLGVWYAKGPGLDRAADAIRHAQYVGTSRHGGVVALVGDDPACKSSSIPNTSEQTLVDLGLPVLTPASVADVFNLGPHAVALSRLSGLWTAVRVVTDIADGTAAVSGALPMPAIVQPEISWRGERFAPALRGIPGPPSSVEVEAELRGPRLEVAREYGYLNALNRIVVDPERPVVAIVAVGHLLGETMSALAELGLDETAAGAVGIRVCQVRMPTPLDPRTIAEFVDGVSHVIVIEEKRPLVERVLREALYGSNRQPAIVGKRDVNGAELIPAYGAVHTDELLRPLWAELTRVVGGDHLRAPGPRRIALQLVDAARTPYFCSGCPHNTSTKVPEGALVGGGIGCHGITQFMDPAMVGHVATTTQMGGEGAQWLGIAPFVATDHIFQNLGDGTFFHSGQLAIQAAVAAGATITYKLLYNDAIAMTGGQSPAESNALAVPDVAGILLRQGIKRVIVTTEDRARYRSVPMPRGVEVWDRSRVVEAQEKLRATGGVTVLIHDQRCAAENRRDRKRNRIPTPAQKVSINERICEGCGDCGTKSNCLSVEPVDTEYGRKTQINQTTCNSDFSCLDGDCPSFVTALPARRRRKRGNRNPTASVPRAVQALLAEPLPEPHVQARRETVIRMPGIGGTGVVTASQILGTAAMLAGIPVSGMDQTGLSQKAGPVISDLRIGGEPGQVATSRAYAESVDLLLGFDMLVAGAALTQGSLRSGQTRAVVSTAKVPTGTMVSDVTVDYPDIKQLQRDLEDALGADRVHWLDAGGLCERLVGNQGPANVLLLGVAAQIGALPMPVQAIERAIELNRVAVEANLAAFRAGRWWAHDRARLLALADSWSSVSAPRQAPDVPRAWLTEVPPALHELVRGRSADLVEYQSRNYAERYAQVVGDVAKAEAQVAPGSASLTEAVARNLHKLMAYKDEYEVARLCLDPVERERIQTAFGPDVRVYWNLHPPVLRSLGLRNKLKLGAWFTPAFAVLYRMRRLRGTVLDPFGWARMRRLERRLVEEYIAAIQAVVAVLDEARIEPATAMAVLPDAVRGYEQLKLERGQRFLEQLAAARTALGA